MTSVKIIGAGGYGGVGITELLLQHPEFKIGCLVGLSDTGRKMSNLYPHLKGFCDEIIVSPNDAKAQEKYEAVFLSTPDGVGMEVAESELEKGARVVDYSGDFRFNTPEKYAEYARFIGRESLHVSPHLLPKTIYGLPEIHPFDATQMLVGNPGCFAASCILGLAPAVSEQLIHPKSIICDSKTGVSGAGRTPSPAFHYPARYEQINAYKLGGHQHRVEIEQELSELAGETVKITLTTQVAPICRGILSCLYAEFKPPMSAAQLMDTYQTFYANKPFVRIFDATASIGTAQVSGSNFCNLMVDVDERNQRLRVISHIDNLMKGQAGNALQSMNRLFGFEETLGLNVPGRYP